MPGPPLLRRIDGNDNGRLDTKVQKIEKTHYIPFLTTDGRPAHLVKRLVRLEFLARILFGVSVLLYTPLGGLIKTPWQPPRSLDPGHHLPLPLYIRT